MTEQEPEQRLPSEVISNIKRELKDKQQKLVGGAQEIRYAHDLVSESEPVWRRLDDVIQTDQPDEVVASSYQFLLDFERQVSAFKPLTDEITAQARYVTHSATFFADATASTASFVNWPPTHPVPSVSPIMDRLRLQTIKHAFDAHDKHAAILDRIDPALGETFRSIKESYYGSAFDRVRKALGAARQTWDHLFDKLAPDDEVRGQPWWSSENPDKPTQVTRKQRIRFAAEKYVKDPNQRAVLVSEAQHMNDVYDKLQRLHTRGPLDETKDSDALFEIVRLIGVWLDSLTL